MKLNQLSPNPGARKAAKRVGRGIGSGTGKTAGRGHKGQKARAGAATTLAATAVLTRVGLLSVPTVVVGWLSFVLLAPEPIPSMPWVHLTLVLALLGGAEALTRWGDRTPWWARADLPVLVTNASDKPEQIPGRVPARGIGVHPMPTEFVAVVWTAPGACRVRIDATVVHAHPACGNGVAWWLEHRRGDRAAVIGEGAAES